MPRRDPRRERQERDERDDPTGALPVWTGPRSNGEYDPLPVPPAVREVRRRLLAAADDAGGRPGRSRREFLASLGGAALALVLLDACTSGESRSRGEEPGGRYRVPEEAPRDPEAARDALGGTGVVVDVQTHFLEYDLGRPSADFGSGFPQASCGEDDPRACFSVEWFVREVFQRSETALAVVSAVPVLGADNPLSTEIMAAARDVVDRLCGTGRVLLHGQANPNVGRLAARLDEMSERARAHRLVAWKVYTHVGDRPWFLDDHDPSVALVGEAFLARARETGVTTVAVHKGLSGGNPYASPVDVGPAAARHPDLRFLVYHSGYEGATPEGPYPGTGPARGVDRLVRTLRDAGVPAGSNVYAELGSTWFNLMRDPTQAAHVLGKLLLAVGEDNVLWGTDSIWYGSPQGQIDAFRAFEISAELQERHGYPALTPERKAKILGANALALHGLTAPPGRCVLDDAEVDAVRAAAPLPPAGPATAAAARAHRREHGWA